MIDGEDDIENKSDEVIEATATEVVDTQVAPDKEVKEEIKDKKPVSLRETLDSAVKESKERAEKVEKEVADKVTTKEPTDKEVITKEVKEPPTPAPVSWSKEAKDTWANLSPATQSAIQKREKEFSDGIKQYSDKAKKYDEFEAIVAPHRQEIAKYGRTESQFFSALLERFNSISHPDLNYRAAAFKALAQDFGVDVSQFAGTTQQQNDQGGKQEITEYASVDPAFLERFNNLEQQHQQFVQNQTQQTQQSTILYMQQWAKDKPYFEKVRQVMGSLLQSGTIPLKNGNLDLDTAYDKAIRLDDEIWKEIQAKEAKDAEDKRRAEAKKKADAIQKAKAASVSIKSGAPSGGNGKSLNGSRSNNGKSQSIRESIMSAVKEVSDS